MVKKVIGGREPAPWPEDTPFAPAHRHDIGLIGEFNIAGEFWHIQPLLDELGIRVLGSLSGDGRFSEIQTLHRAQVNMLVCSGADQRRPLAGAALRHAVVRRQFLWRTRHL